MSKKFIKGTEEKKEPVKKPYLLFNKDGETNSIDNCGVVYIPDHEGAEKFRTASVEADCVCDGIDGSGVYIWNDEIFEYTWLQGVGNISKQYLFNIGESLVQYAETL